jgi:hypothetical protein
MARKADADTVSMGFRVKSGWAVAVLLGGPCDSPRALSCHVINLSDPNIPETKQPYHAAMGLLLEDKSEIRRRTRIVNQVTAQSVRELINHFQELVHKVRKACIVVGSQIDPALISNPHIRAHAMEGRLFRSVLEDALKSHGLSCYVHLERDIYKKATVVLKRSENELKKMVTLLGRSLEGPWRAEEKLASLAAWMALAK